MGRRFPQIHADTYLFLLSQIICVHPRPKRKFLKYPVYTILSLIVYEYLVLLCHIIMVRSNCSIFLKLNQYFAISSFMKKRSQWGIGLTARPNHRKNQKGVFYDHSPLGGIGVHFLDFHRRYSPLFQLCTRDPFSTTLICVKI